MKRICVAAARLPLYLLCLLLLPGCAAGGAERADESEIAFFAMDTYMTIRAFGADDALLGSARALVEELEAELSVTREDSAIYTLNRTGHAVLTDSAAALLRRALALCAETDGALDISVYPVVRAWGFTSGEYRVPDETERAALLRRVDYTRVRLDGSRASLEEGMEIDLGAVTKGYTGDRLAALLREAGVESALMDLGGNVQAVGTKPDGSAWRVAIRDPRGDGLLGVLPVAGQAVVTSGGYERYFIDDGGALHWHIMDPATAAPAASGLISVSVIGDEGVLCDALSTALFVMGPEAAEACWRAHRDFEMALVTEDGELILTPDLAAVFTPDSALAYTIRTLDE